MQGPARDEGDDQDKEQTMGNADDKTTATKMTTTTGMTHCPPPSNCSWAQMMTRVIWAQVIFLIFVSYFLFKIYIVSLDAIYWVVQSLKVTFPVLNWM